jgi:hypothetical protein
VNNVQTLDIEYYANANRSRYRPCIGIVYLGLSHKHRQASAGLYGLLKDYSTELLRLEDPHRDDCLLNVASLSVGEVSLHAGY